MKLFSMEDLLLIIILIRFFQFQLNFFKNLLHFLNSTILFQHFWSIFSLKFLISFQLDVCPITISISYVNSIFNGDIIFYIPIFNTHKIIYYIIPSSTISLPFSSSLKNSLSTNKIIQELFNFYLNSQHQSDLYPEINNFFQLLPIINSFFELFQNNILSNYKKFQQCKTPFLIEYLLQRFLYDKSKFDEKVYSRNLLKTYSQNQYFPKSFFLIFFNYFFLIFSTQSSR
jgi:hypothetical protein